MSSDKDFYVAHLSAIDKMLVDCPANDPVGRISLTALREKFRLKVKEAESRTQLDAGIN